VRAKAVSVAAMVEERMVTRVVGAVVRALGASHCTGIKGGLLLVQKRCSLEIVTRLAMHGIAVLPRLSARHFEAACGACGCIPHEDWKGLELSTIGGVDESGRSMGLGVGSVVSLAIRGPGLPGDVSVGEGRAMASVGAWTMVLRGGDGRADDRQEGDKQDIDQFSGPRTGSLLLYGPTESAARRLEAAARAGQRLLLQLLMRPFVIEAPACIAMQRG